MKVQEALLFIIIAAIVIGIFAYNIYSTYDENLLPISSFLMAGSIFNDIKFII